MFDICFTDLSFEWVRESFLHHRDHMGSNHTQGRTQGFDLYNYCVLQPITSFMLINPCSTDHTIDKCCTLTLTLIVQVSIVAELVWHCWLKFDLGLRTPRIDPTGVQTHDLWNMIERSLTLTLFRPHSYQWLSIRESEEHYLSLYTFTNMLPTILLCFKRVYWYPNK